MNGCRSGNWYHGGAGYVVQGSRPAVAAPPPSQIPCLGLHTDDGVAAADVCRPVVRDTDSAYVRLARQGGQRDLLSMESDDPRGSSIDSSAARSNALAQTRQECYYDNAGYHNNTTAAAGSRPQHSLTQYQASAPQ